MKLKDYEADVMRYSLDVIHYLMSRGASQSDAEDSAQDTLLKILELDILLAPDKLRAFIFRLTIRNYINKYHRAQNYQKIIEQLTYELPQFSPPDILHDDSEIKMLMKNLRPMDEKLLLAYYFDKKTTKEISEMTGNSLSKVKVDLYRARKRLKKILEKEGYDSWIN